MTALALPTTPAPASMGIELLSVTNALEPAFAGTTQEIRRKGSKYALVFRMPPMSYLTSMDWDDLMAEGDRVLMRVYQPGFDTGAPGSPVVDGAGQSGTTLNIRGITPHYVVRKGQFLSVVTGGQRYLYRAKAEVVADAAGEAAVPTRTMLRKPHADGDTVELAQPMIEGFVRDRGEWLVGTDRLVGLQFTVREP